MQRAAKTKDAMPTTIIVVSDDGDLGAILVGATVGAIVGLLGTLIAGSKGIAEPRGLLPPNRAKLALNCPLATLAVRLCE